MRFLERVRAARSSLGLGGSTTERGRAAEDLAVRFLIKDCGYRIVERNHRNSRGEIDVIGWSPADEGGERYLCFVEIKMRSSSWSGSAAEAVDQAKQRRLRAAAEVYLSGMQEVPDCRFDVVAVERDGAAADARWRCELFANAFI